MVAEGTATEVMYLDAVKQLIRDSQTDSVGVKSVGVGRDPLAVLRKALELRENAEREGDPYDWCCVVVDVDNHARLEECLVQAVQRDIHVVVSNPCFEIWLLWHLSDFRRACDARTLAAELARHGVSGKRLPASFPFSAYPAAVDRSRTADADLSSRRTGPNPSSAMPVLIDLMLGL